MEREKGAVGIKNSIFQVKFDDSVKGYGKVDGILAVAYFFYAMAFTVLFGLLSFHTDLIQRLFSWSKIPSEAIFKFVLYIPVALIEAGPVFIILKCRKQSISSIGIRRDKVIKSVLLGVLFSVPPTLLNRPSMEFDHLLNLSDALLTFIYYFLEIAFVEEIIFRGFIQTRIQGLIRSKWISIFIVGVMFSLMHIPFHMLEYNTTFVNCFLLHFGSLLVLFLTHIYFVYLYTRDNNILASVVAHTLWNFILDLFSGM